MPVRQRHLSSTIGMLSIGAFAVGAGYVSSSLQLSWWLIGFNALLLVCLVLERRRTAGKIDVFEPLVIFVASWGLFFIARPTAMLVADDFSLGPLDARSGFNGALIMAALGALGFAFGYTGRLGAFAAHRFRLKEVVPDRGVLIAAATSCALVGVLLFLVFLSGGGGGASIGTVLSGRSAAYGALFAGAPAYVFYGVYFCFPAALTLYWQSLRDGSRALRVAALAASLPPVALAFFAGTRSWLLPMLFAYVMIRYLHHQRRPRAAALVLGGLIVFFVGIVFVGTYRNAATRDRTGVQQLLVDTVGRPSQSSSSLLRSGDTEMVALLSIIKEKVPSEFDYRYGLATGELFVHLIPRQLWKSKPRAGDEMFTNRVLSDPSFGGAPRQYTPLANFYLDFGYFGVFAGMILLGILGRFHLEFLATNENAPIRQLLYAATLPLWIPLLRGSLTDTAGRLFFVLPPALIILFVSTRYFARRVEVKPDGSAGGEGRST